MTTATGTITLGSLFAGIGGFDLGFARAGIETRWLVEWDKDCQRVLAERFPGVPIHGDIATVDPADLAPVDIITFGSPCQDLSVAGKRAGLNGSRSGLFYEACRIIAAVRPAIAVWENVPGAFSSLQGRDFGAVLDALAELGALDIGWRVLDAQFFGVAQRRRRVFVVADFRGRRCGEILAFADGLSGHPAPRRETGAGVAQSIRASTGSRGTDVPDRMTFVPQVAPVLTQNYGKQPDNSDTNAGPMIVAIQDGSMPRAKKQNGIGIAYDAPMYTLDGHGAHAVAHAVTTHQAKGGDPTTDNYVVTHTLSANGADASEDGTGRGTPLVTAWVGSYGGGGGAASEVAPTLQASGGEDERGVRNPIIVDLAQVTSPGNYSNPQPGDPCHPLTSAANQSVVAFNWQSGGDQRLGLSAERTTALGTSQTPAIAFSSKDSGNDAGDIAPTLRAMPHDTSHSNGGGQVAVAFTQNQNGDVLSGDVMHALSTNGNATGRNSAKVATTTVRRLTPTECARLQGFPDDWLNTTPPLSDSAKYRMLGNAVCVNVAEWLGKRIAEVLR